LKLSRREVKEQQTLLELLKKEKLSEEEIDNIYTEINPGILGDVTANGAFFTPYGLAQDVAVMNHARGHVLDLCGGIGMLSYRAWDMDTYEKRIRSLTIIELNPKYVEIGKKLLPQANWICGSVFDKQLLDSLAPDGGKWDTIISNPPFGKAIVKEKIEWLNYNSAADLMVLEVALRYGKDAYFILPSNSVPFRFSGAPYYQENIGRELTRFIKINKEFLFNMSCDGIDCSIYRDEWKNLNGISVEAVNVSIHPYYLDCIEDSLSGKLNFSTK
jgi:predicted RNA methylase